MTMSAKSIHEGGPSGEGAGDRAQMRCPMCRQTLTWASGDAPPRRCPSCRAWLAAATFRLRQTELDASLSISTPQERDTIPDADATPSGWKRIPRASIFQRFGGELDESDFATTPEQAEEKEELSSLPPTPLIPRKPKEALELDRERRAVKFAFEPPPETDRFRKRREVEASSLPERVAMQEHADLTDDDAIDAWLDLVESEIEDLPLPEEEEASQGEDVPFELVSPASEELSREPRAVPSPGQVVVEEAGATTILISELVDEVHHTELFGGLFEEDAPDPSHDIEGVTREEVAPPNSELRDEADEEEELASSSTLMMFGAHPARAEREESPSEHARQVTARPVQERQPLHEASTPAPALDEVSVEPPLVVQEEESDSPGLTQVDEVKEESGGVRGDALDAPAMESPPGAIQRASMPPARWRLVRRALGVVALVCVFCLGIFAGMSWVQMKHSPDPGEQALADSPRAVLENMIMLPRERASRNAVGTARTMVGLSLSQDYMTRQKDVATELLDAGELDRALKVLGVVWERGELRSIELGERYASAALTQERYKLARQVAVQTYLLTDAERDVAAQKALRELFNRAIEEDAALHPEVVEIKKDVQVDVIRALGGGKSISLKFKKGDETTHAFKPSQLDWAEGWRAEVASYLFCEAVGCHFKVPRSEPARISKEDFYELYGRFNSTKQTEYAKNFESNLLWVKEAGEDGVEREYLYGVLKEWMPGFVDYPIEYKDIWEDWLDATKPDDWVRRDLSDALRVLRFRQDGRFFQNIMSERRDASTYDVARGLSDIQLFDFVTSNWDRYSGVETYYGVNNQFDDGAFLSLDNGAAFHVLTQRKVEQHFEPVTRFSKSTVAALELLRPGILDEVLFPEASPEAKQRLEVFWAQRDSALKRVKSLSKTHGKSAVLYFE